MIQIGLKMVDGVRNQQKRLQRQLRVRIGQLVEDERNHSSSGMEIQLLLMVGVSNKVRNKQQLTRSNQLLLRLTQMQIYGKLLFSSHSQHKMRMNSLSVRMRTLRFL